jgi:diguanylate cyclase (GGDEF)-like protein
MRESTPIVHGLITRFGGDNERFPLEHQMRNIFMLGGFIIGILSTLNNIIVLHDFMNSLVSVIGSVIFFFCYYISRYRSMETTASVLIIIFINFIITPVLWIYNGGTQGGLHYYIVLFAVFYTAGFSGKKIWVALISLFIIFISLIALEYYHPELITLYDTRFQRYSDVGISYLISMTFCVVILLVFHYRYNLERIKVASYAHDLELLSVTDSLTGLFNHRQILLMLEQQMSLYTRYGTRCSTFLFDIDHFKQVNDRHGHVRGDQVLEEVAKLIRSKIRKTDIFGRYGGEEFLIIFTHTDIDGARHVAEMVRSLVEHHEFPFNIAVTVSGGVTQYSEGTVTEFIDRVDALLYKAKKGGRNQIAG